LRVAPKPAVAPMKVAQIPKPGADFEIVERPIPEPDAGQVRIKVKACGICHSDVLVKEGALPWIQYPRVPGHEVAGIIDEVGPGVTVWKTGSVSESAGMAGMTAKDAADALLYVGPRDNLTQVPMTRAELDGTPYGKEVQRRLTIEGFPSGSGAGSEKGEAPQFHRPQTSSGGAPPPPLPPPPKNMDAPLPPRPTSQ